MASDSAQTSELPSRGLALRTIAGFVALVAAMGAALFVAAGTLNYWQAWLYLLAFFGSAGAITLYLWRTDRALLERRVNAGPGAEEQIAQRLVQSVAALAFIGILVVPALDHRFGWSTVPPLASVAADVVVVVGFWIVFQVFRVNTFTAATIEVAGEQTVVSTGPYAVVRHPMYAGALLMLLATPIALGSWWGVLAFVPMLAAIVWRLRAEEAFLVDELPGYAEYRARVKYRLIPRIW